MQDFDKIHSNVKDLVPIRQITDNTQSLNYNKKPELEIK